MFRFFLFWREDTDLPICAPSQAEGARGADNAAKPSRKARFPARRAKLLPRRLDTVERGAKHGRTSAHAPPGVRFKSVTFCYYKQLKLTQAPSTTIARTPKTHFIRFGEPRSGPPPSRREALRQANSARCRLQIPQQNRNSDTKGLRFLCFFDIITLQE